MPNINQLTTELQSVPGFNGANNQAVQVATAVSFVPTVQISPTYNLTRKPATSALTLGAASFTAGVLTPDVPGLYLVQVTNAGAGGPMFQVLAVPAAALALPQFGSGAIVRLMSTPGFSASSCAASVELASPGPFFGFDMRLIGGATLAGIANSVLAP